jgi:hypothetical protein
VRHHRLPSLSISIALALSLSGCSGCARYRRCSAPPPAVIATLPRQLSETGLFASVGSSTVAPGVRAYEPDYPLWSDGAEKRRWIALPEGESIDTSDPDDWSFPIGTKLWKEFSLEGRRVETRLLAKIGSGATDWAGAAYVWDAEQRDATLALEGVTDAHGLPYDVPKAADCQGCHGGRKSYVLGFSALQLADPGLPLSLSDLNAEGRLSRPIERAPVITGDDVEQSALGYLHANCGHCHNRARPPRGEGPRCYDPERSLDFWLASDSPPSAGLANAVTSSVPRFVTPGDPDASRLIALVSRRNGFLHMPPLGSRRVDPDGVRTLRAWVAGMRGERTNGR